MNLEEKNPFTYTFTQFLHSSFIHSSTFYGDSVIQPFIYETSFIAINSSNLVARIFSNFLFKLLKKLSWFHMVIITQLNYTKIKLVMLDLISHYMTTCH